VRCKFITSQARTSPDWPWRGLLNYAFFRERCKLATQKKKLASEVVPLKRRGKPFVRTPKHLLVWKIHFILLVSTPRRPTIGKNITLESRCFLRWRFCIIFTLMKVKRRKTIHCLKWRCYWRFKVSLKKLQLVWYKTYKKLPHTMSSF